MSNNEHISLSQVIIHKNHNGDDRYPQSSTALLASALSSSAIDDEATRSSLSSSSTGFKDIAAKIIGYIMGIGSMLLYSPIIITLLQTKNSDGFSISTWIFNVFGTMLAISYPVKRKFPISTYVELITVLLQGIGILGLICLYQGLASQYLLGIIPSILLFTAFLSYPNTSPDIIKSLQMLSIGINTYANIPQIILTFNQKKASWSWITAALSMAGCFARILTTLQLTKDRLALLGYIFGFATNAILLLQVIVYN